jgi:hypothetical protein
MAMDIFTATFLSIITHTKFWVAITWVSSVYTTLNAMQDSLRATCTPPAEGSFNYAVHYRRISTEHLNRSTHSRTGLCKGRCRSRQRRCQGPVPG